MHYNVQSGAIASPRTRLTTSITGLRKRNWLPAGVAAVMGAWIGLLFITISQAGILADPNPTQPQTAGSKQSEEQALSVANVTSTESTGGSGMTVTPPTASTSTSTSTNTTPSTQGYEAAANSTPQETSNEIGGRGADTPEITPTPVETLPPTVPSTDEPVIETPTPSVDTDLGLEVDLPLVPPISVDLGLGL
jgi:cytoskeletal protein RodZ